MLDFVKSYYTINIYKRLTNNRRKRHGKNNCAR